MDPLATPQSYKSDPLVPPFPDDKPILFYDGVCVLCSGFADTVLRLDRRQRIRLAAAQSPLGQSIYTHYGLQQGDYETNLFLADGIPHQKLNAFLKVMSVLGFPWSLTGIAYILPAPIRNWCYDRVARNRYRVFGKHDACILVMKEHEDRFLT